MDISSWRVLTVAFLVSLAVSAARPEDAPSTRTQKADEIVRKHVEAVGGLAKIKAIEALRITGRLAEHGAEFPFTLWVKRPNRVRVDLDINGRALVQGYNGQTPWWVNPLLGIAEPREMPEEFADAVRRWTDFEGPLVDYGNKGHTVEYEGEEKTDSGVLHKIKVTLSGGEVWRVYIDGNTYLEVKRTFPQVYGGQAREVTTSFSNYALVEGVNVYRVIQGEGFDGSPYIMTLQSFEVNPQIDDGWFEKP